jgi:hypothetical protein
MPSPRPASPPGRLETSSGPSRKSSWRLAGQIRSWTASSSSPQLRLRLPPGPRHGAGVDHSCRPCDDGCAGHDSVVGAVVSDGPQRGQPCLGAAPGSADRSGCPSRRNAPTPRRVQPCCMVMGDDRVVLGDLATASLSDIWHDEPYRRFRSALVTPRPPTVCQGCSSYRRVF